VQFAQDATPQNLPGGNGIGFETTAGFSADSDPPVQPNGVNPGESLGVIFNLISGKTYQDTLAAIDLGLGGSVYGSLRIGIHVQGFADGGSESFVNTHVIPEPAGLMVWSLLGLAAASCGVMRRRKRIAVGGRAPWSPETRQAVRRFVAEKCLG
jgi:hypothetical protein